MDLMRTLLIYMSAVLALAIQSTSAPTVTPTPSPAPQEIAETAEIPETAAPGGDTITAAPAAQGAKITPFPVPTITPNTKAYHNLAMGAKGKEVKQLQEKLIELKYLPEGSADGAYGRKTYNAVKKFQYYNGLSADGVAGRKTQTNLFENPDIVANPEVTEASETKAPETEAPATETPVVTEIPMEETPGVTEIPATEEPEATAAPETTEAPAEEPKEDPAEAPTEEPAEAPTEEPKEEPAETPADEPEDVENVDLDADVYELITASVALNEGSGPLEFIAMEDGVPVTARPRMSQNGAKIRISLDDMCKCAEGWELTDEGVGTVVLEAAGYTLVLYNESKGSYATLDGTEIPMKEDDFDFETEGHFINAEFLAAALKGEAEWDQEENTLMLRIRDKDAAGATD